MDIYGVIGWPIKHSLSPAMHNAAFKALGIDAEYKLFEVKPEDLESFLLGNIVVEDAQKEKYSAGDIIGFNITIPHKVRAFHLLEDRAVFHGINRAHILTDAVNTVKRDGNRIEYYNTDVYGFTEALRNDLNFNPVDKCAFVFGCGGAGRAVIVSLLQDGMKVKKIYSYDMNEAIIEEARKHFFKKGFEEAVRQRLEFVSQEQIAKKIEASDLLVNASPVGMKEGDERLVVPKDLLRKELYVFDLVYNRKTRLFKEASALECHVVDGRGMLAAQGAFSFSLWRDGVKPVDVIGVMRKELFKP